MSSPRNRSARSTRPDPRRVGGGWLSLFAMLMIFIGPLVSQSVSMDHHAGMTMGMNMPMVSGHDHGHEHAEQGHHSQEQNHDCQSHAVWEKCGYCTLLFNCPALPQALSPLSLSNLPPPLHALYATRHGHASQAIFPGARSRAPPLSIHV